MDTQQIIYKGISHENNKKEIFLYWLAQAVANRGLPVYFKLEIDTPPPLPFENHNFSFYRMDV